MEFIQGCGRVSLDPIMEPHLELGSFLLRQEVQMSATCQAHLLEHRMNGCRDRLHSALKNQALEHHRPRPDHLTVPRGLGDNCPLLESPSQARVIERASPFPLEAQAPGPQAPAPGPLLMAHPAALRSHWAVLGHRHSEAVHTHTLISVCKGRETTDQLEMYVENMFVF